MPGYGDPPIETRFSSENQPPNSGRKEGSKTRSKVIARVTGAMLSLDSLPAKKATELRTALESMGIKEETIDAQTLMVISQVVQAIKGNTYAFNSLMDNEFGKLSQSIEIKETDKEIYDLSKLTDEENAELDSIEERRTILLAKAQINTASDPHAEG